MTASTLKRRILAAVIGVPALALVIAGTDPAAGQDPAPQPQPFIQQGTSPGQPFAPRRRACNFQQCYDDCLQSGGTIGSAAKNYRCSNKCSRLCGN